MAASKLVPVGFRFFMFFLPGFETKLMIPAPYAAQNLSWVKNANRRQRLTLRSADRTKWEVDVFMQDGDMFIGGEGWRRLVTAKKLQEGYLLVFRLKGRKSFNFRVYGLSTTCEKKKRKKIAPTSEGPKAHFEIGVSRCHLKGSPAHIAIGFRDSSGLVAGEELELRDGTGGKWGVKVYGREEPHPEVYITKGWRKFMRDNSLRVGDRILFELIGTDTKKIFKFKVRRASS